MSKCFSSRARAALFEHMQLVRVLENITICSLWTNGLRPFQSSQLPGFTNDCKLTLTDRRTQCNHILHICIIITQLFQSKARLKGSFSDCSTYPEPPGRAEAAGIEVYGCCSCPARPEGHKLPAPCWTPEGRRTPR